MDVNSVMIIGNRFELVTENFCNAYEVNVAPTLEIQKEATAIIAKMAALFEPMRVQIENLAAIGKKVNAEINRACASLRFLETQTNLYNKPQADPIKTVLTTADVCFIQQRPIEKYQNPIDKRTELSTGTVTKTIAADRNESEKHDWIQKSVNAITLVGSIGSLIMFICWIISTIAPELLP